MRIKTEVNNKYLGFEKKQWAYKLMDVKKIRGYYEKGKL